MYWDYSGRLEINRGRRKFRYTLIHRNITINENTNFLLDNIVTSNLLKLCNKINFMEEEEFIKMRGC